MDRVSTAFQRLTSSASKLNAVSDELGKPIASIEAALKKLNLGVSTWVEFAGSVDHNIGWFWERSLGYAKVSGKWCIAIRTSSGDFSEEPNEEYWPFSEAPRAYRLEAVDRLLDLLEKLVTAADETTGKLKEKIDTTNQVAKAISEAPAVIKDALLAEIRKSKVVFYNTVVTQAKAIDLTADRLTFTFLPSQRALRDAADQNRGWLEELARRVSSRKITVSITQTVDSPRK